MTAKELFICSLSEPIGSGYDTYCPMKCFTYVEAIAAYGRAAHALGLQDYVEECVAALPPGNNWGLPWDWNLYGDPSRKIPAGNGFVTTTCDVINFLLDSKRFVDFSWLIDHRLVYGEHPSAHVRIYNAVAQSGATLARGGIYSDTVSFLSPLSYRGVWPYSDEKSVVEHHQPMILDALIDLGEDVNIIPYWGFFFDDNGRGYSTPEKHYPMSVRFMSLSALMFAKAGFVELANVVREYILSNYVQSDGTIYSTPNGSHYVREAAQALSALARLELVNDR